MTALMLLLLACRSPDEDAANGDTAPATETSCTDGVDNDANGLLDCEDAACDGVGSCVELDCTDGRDDEADGAVDCFDSDCWGEGTCQPVLTRASGTAYVDARRGRTINRCYGTTFGTEQTSVFTSDRASTSVQVRNLRGTVQLGAVGPTCAFQAYGVSWGQRDVSGALVPRDANRSRFAVASDCPFDFDPATLPAQLTLQHPWDPTQWAITANGLPLYGVASATWEVTPTDNAGDFAECRWTAHDEVGAGSAQIRP